MVWELKDYMERQPDSSMLQGRNMYQLNWYIYVDMYIYMYIYMYRLYIYVYIYIYVYVYIYILRSESRWLATPEKMAIWKGRW